MQPTEERWAHQGKRSPLAATRARFWRAMWIAVTLVATCAWTQQAFAARRYHVIVQTHIVRPKVWSPEHVYYQYIVVLQNTSNKTLKVDIKAGEQNANHPSGRSNRVLVYRDIVLKAKEAKKMTLFYHSPATKFRCDIVKEVPVGGK